MFPNDETPSAEKFLRVLTEIRDQLSETDLTILRTQYSRPGRTVSSQDVRDFLEYGGIGASNLAYGHLGKKFGKRLGFSVNDRPPNRPGWWRAIATSDKVGDHFTWTLRPEFATALERGGIVDTETDGMIDAPDVDLPQSFVGFAVEGRKLLVQHLRRERNRALVAAKKASAKSLACEVCGFDSSKYYGIDYCEAHHRTSLSTSDDQVVTTLDHLALVCANCHRIIHSEYPALSIEKVRSLIRDHGKDTRVEGV